MKKLFIITNESIFEKDGKFFCDNLDLKSTPEKLNENFEVNLIGRKSITERSHEIKISNINLYSSIFLFIIAVIRASKAEKADYLIVSITPYTFVASFFLRIFGKTPFVYLRSDGFKEYKAIIGFLGQFIYYFMFNLVSSISNLISCNETILRGKKGKIILPSQLSNIWFENIKENKFEKNKLLYVGRIKVEKGIFSLINLIKGKDNIFLTIVGGEKKKIYKIYEKNIKIVQIQNEVKKLIKFYDESSIFILPSFTEGYPMVLLEALARKRPVIVFDEIKHVAKNVKGVFVVKRNIESLVKTINHIKQNYTNIAKLMKKNNLPTNIQFIENLSNIIKKND